MTETTVNQPHESEIAKTLADTELTRLSIAEKRAEIERAAETSEAMRRQELAEAQRLEAEAREAAAKAGAQEIYLRQQQRKENLELIADHYVHHHFFNGPVDDRSVFACLNALAAWDRVSPGRLNPDGSVAEEGCPMHITVNSPGGGVIDGMHLFDQINSYSLRGGGTHKVTMTVRGYAASMAGILLQSADVRQIGRESYIMVHEVATMARGKIGELQDEVKFLETMSDRIANIFVDRSAGKITREEFDKSWRRTDWWLTSDQAFERGFVDEIA